MTHHTSLAWSLLLLLASVLPAPAQQRPETWERARERVALPPVAADPPAPPRTARLVAGGLGGGALGMLMGASLGYFLETGGGCEREYVCGFGGVLIGGMAGEVTGIPLGVHIANGRRGHLPRALLRSAALGAGMSLLVLAGSMDPVGGAVVLLGTAAVQIATSVHVERSEDPHSR